MTDPWLPPYLGSWASLIAALKHNPFLGSGDPRQKVLFQTHLDAQTQAEPVPVPWRQFGPVPDPWTPVVAFLVSTISLKDVAARLPKGSVQTAFEHRLDETLEQAVDDICPTPPIPWPWPGPPPWTQEIVLELTAAANSLPEGRVREGILDLAARIVQKAFAATGVGNPG